MTTSEARLFARYERLADRLQQHFIENNDSDAVQRLTRLSEQQFSALYRLANSDPAIRDWLYCIEHGYPAARRVHGEAA